MSGRQWSIKLVGATAHLSLLASIFAEDPATIVLTDDEYYLGGSFLNHCVGAREAIRIGEARLRLMLGAARIETGYDAFQADLFGMVCCKEANGSTAIILVTGESTQESGNDAVCVQESGRSIVRIQPPAHVTNRGMSQPSLTAVLGIRQQ